LLTNKEIAVLELKQKVLTQVEIANKLRISQPAVSFIVSGDVLFIDGVTGSLSFLARFFNQLLVEKYLIFC